MIDRGHALPVAKQCAALGISRGSVYYEPVEVSASDLALMRTLDELHLEHLMQRSGLCADRSACPTSGSSVDRVDNDT